MTPDNCELIAWGPFAKIGECDAPRKWRPPLDQVPGPMSPLLTRRGRSEVGTIDPMVITRRVEGPRLLSLGGRSWKVTYTDWKRRQVFVEPSDQAGSSRWAGIAAPLSYAVTSAMRRVLLGRSPEGVALTRRATDRLAALRAEQAHTVGSGLTVVSAASGHERWWTWGGARANALLAGALSSVSPGLVDEVDRYDNRYLRLGPMSGPTPCGERCGRPRSRFGADLAGSYPAISEQAVKQLKFAELLPPGLAAATLAARAADPAGAAAIGDLPIADA